MKLPPSTLFLPLSAVFHLAVNSEVRRFSLWLVTGSSNGAFVDQGWGDAVWLAVKCQ